MKNILNMIRFLLGFSILIFMIFFAISKINNQYCSIDKIKIDMVDGNEFVTKGFVQDYLKEKTLDPESMRRKDICFRDIEKILIDHPSIKQAEVYSDIFGNVSIEGFQRRPIVRVQDGKKGYYLDEEGKEMPFSQMYTARTLLVTGDVKTVEQLDLFYFSEYIYKDDFLRDLIVQVDITDSKLLILTRVGERIEFGNVLEIDKKFQKLMLYYEKGNPQNKKYRIINLEYNNQIVCKK